MAKEDKVIITCALTGAVTTRAQCPAIPYTPVELGEEARRAFEAGATVVHIHAREEDGSPSFRKERFIEIAQEVRSRSPVLINFSTGAIGISIEDRTSHLSVTKPAIAALNMGTINYARYSPKRKDWVFNFVFENSIEDITKCIQIMHASDVVPELECFDSGHIGTAWPLLDMGVLKPPLNFSFIIGLHTGIPASTASIHHQRTLLPPGSNWQVIGISHDQWRWIAASLTLGGNIRVGLEDNFYVHPGVQAQSNADLVQKAVRMARDIGREPATRDEAIQALGLKNIQ